MSINSETAHLHQSNSQLLLSGTRLVIQSMINLDSCYKEKFMVTWPRAYHTLLFLEMDANLTGLFLFNFESTSCKNHSDTNMVKIH